MRKIMKDNFKRIAALLLLVLLCMAMVMGGLVSAPIAYADTLIGDVKMDRTNVMDDLESATVDGEPFDFRDYAFDESSETNVFAFAEYCYSFYGNMQGNYGLYVYVHNPRGLTFNLQSTSNSIQLRAGSQEHSVKYTLLYLNSCERENYEGLFLKFKVMLAAEQKADIFDSLNSAERVYEVAEIELVSADTGEAQAYPVSTKYYFSGYAAGYGSDPEAGYTLSMRSEQADTLSLTPHPTAYRPEGTNGKSDYTQDSLHSVYFAVPNDFIDLYGEMSAVHARWLDAVLKPILVTGNQDAYNAIRKYLGQNIGTFDDALNYHYYGDLLVQGNSLGGFQEWLYGFGFNARVSSLTGILFYDGDQRFVSDDGSVVWENSKEGYDVETLYYMFNAGDGIDSADNYTVSSEELLSELKKSKDVYGGELVNDKYSRAIFESVAEAFTEVNIDRDTEYALTSETISQTWWEKLWGNSHVESSEVFDGIQAIYAVDPENDLMGTEYTISERLYISEGDVQDLKDFCNARENEDCTVYLFRYQTSDYISQEATLHSGSNVFDFKEVDTNAYFFQETVNLDFDIIDVTFSNGMQETVVPVVMTPIDVVPSATPPVHTESDQDQNWLKWLFMALGIIVLLVILMPIIPYIAKAIVWVISLPFKAVAAIVDAVKKRRRNK